MMFEGRFEADLAGMCASHYEIRRETDSDPRDALAGDRQSLARTAVHPPG
jgi:hypothetical protein